MTCKRNGGILESIMITGEHEMNINHAKLHFLRVQCKIGAGDSGLGARDKKKSFLSFLNGSLSQPGAKPRVHDPPPPFPKNPQDSKSGGLRNSGCRFSTPLKVTTHFMWSIQHS